VSVDRQTDEGILAESIRANLARVEEGIERACQRAGRNRSTVRLLAVSKFNPSVAVQAAMQAGLRLFGENRVQEAMGKFPSLDLSGQRPAATIATAAIVATTGGDATGPVASLPGVQLHLLGHLQSNKASKAVQLFDCVQSVDSPDILVELAKQAAKAGRVLDVLLELHTGEESKSGFADEAALFEALELAGDLPSLRPRGLMTMAPFTTDQAAIQRSFAACRLSMERAAARFGFPDFDVLSMGMTNDFELAIAEGASLLRIGTAIFGARQYP